MKTEILIQVHFLLIPKDFEVETGKIVHGRYFSVEMTFLPPIGEVIVLPTGRYKIVNTIYGEIVDSPLRAPPNIEDVKIRVIKKCE